MPFFLTQFQANKARRPVLIMSDLTLMTIAMLRDGAGGFPMAGAVAAKTLFGMPVITSGNVSNTEILGVDADRIWLADNLPEFDSSSEVTLVMADAEAPAPTMGDGAGNVGVSDSIKVSDAAGTTPPAEVHSVFQSDGTAIRMVQPISWNNFGTTQQLTSVGYV